MGEGQLAFYMMLYDENKEVVKRTDVKEKGYEFYKG